jgi:hypothetical protein
VLAWIHFGSSNACYDWMKSTGGWVTDKKVEPMQRRIVSSPSLARVATSTLSAVEAHRVVADRAAPGELRDVQAAGYPNVIGIVGRHLFFRSIVRPSACPYATVRRNPDNIDVSFHSRLYMSAEVRQYRRDRHGLGLGQGA